MSPKRKIVGYRHEDPVPWEAKEHFKMIIQYDDGSEEVDYDEDNVTRYLIEKGHISIGFVKIHDEWWKEDDSYHRDTMLGLYVNANDVFIWGCAEGHAISSFDELGEIYEITKTKPIWGAAIWAAHKRKVKPQPPVVEDMKKRGEWDETLEQYESYYERAERKKNEKS